MGTGGGWCVQEAFGAYRRGQWWKQPHPGEKGGSAVVENDLVRGCLSVGGKHWRWRWLAGVRGELKGLVGGD